MWKTHAPFLYHLDVLAVRFTSSSFFLLYDSSGDMSFSKIDKTD